MTATTAARTTAKASKSSKPPEDIAKMFKNIFNSHAMPKTTATGCPANSCMSILIVASTLVIVAQRRKQTSNLLIHLSLRAHRLSNLLPQ